MFEVGRVCVKIAGRDSNKTCVVVDVLDANYVMIDGETRRRKVNIRHLEPLNKVVKIKKEASSAEVSKALGIEMKPSKPKKAAARPKKMKAKKSAVSLDEKVKPAKK